MKNINWQDESKQDGPQQDESQKGLAGSPFFWMASTMVLIGIIIGFFVGKLTGDQTALNSSASTLGLSASEQSASQDRITPPTSASLAAVDLEKDHIRGSLDA